MFDFYATEKLRNNYLQYTTTGPYKIEVFYKHELDGGGMGFGQDYIPVLKDLYPGRVFNKAYEWCSGPGFIGFSLLSHNLCKSLCLSDLYDPSITATEVTIAHEENNCKNSVTTYLCKDVGLIPLHEQFDLVVSNPPHFNTNGVNSYTGIRLSHDLNWQAHQNFFKNIKQHLTRDGIILLQEHIAGLSLSEAQEMTDINGLKITNVFHRDNQNETNMYYIEIQHTEE